MKHRNREGPGARTPSRKREKQSYGCERDDSPETEQRKSFKLCQTHFRFMAGISYTSYNGNIQEARESLLSAYQDGSIDDTEFALLYDLNSSGNLEFPYWKYGRFDLDSMTDDECKAEFRFYKNDIYLLGEVLDIPDIMKCPNGVLVDGMEALSALLKRFAYPCRFADMVPRFGRPVPQLCMITNRLMDYVFNEYSHLLTQLCQPWLSRDRLRHFAATIHDKGAPLENCWGFIDGTVRPLCKPDQTREFSITDIRGCMG